MLNETLEAEREYRKDMKGEYNRGYQKGYADAMKKMYKCKYLKKSNTPLIGNYSVYCNNPNCEEYQAPLLGDECDECENKIV